MSWKEEATMKISAMRLVLVAVLGVASPALAVPNVTQVDCNKGKTITGALKNASPGDTLLVSGVCHERVTITTDRITLDGQGSAVIDGGGVGPTDFSGVVTVDGARGVAIKGLSVRNGPAEGILGQRGAAFTVEETTVHDNAFTGIAVADGSTARLTDVTSRRNRLGLDVFTGSAATLHGAVVLEANTGNGADINGIAVLEIRGAHVRASGNGGIGIVAGSGAELAIFNLPSSIGSTLTASGNGFAGILIAGSQLTAFPPCKITVANNVIGLFVANGNAVVVNGNAEFVAEGNQTGLRFVDAGSGIFQGGPLTVRNNGVGLVGDGAGTLTILSDPAKPSRIVSNGTDVDLKFGTRATFDGVAIGSITCDQTVLSRGTTVCP
jgi:Right handed beta helix region